MAYTLSATIIMGIVNVLGIALVRVMYHDISYGGWVPLLIIINAASLAFIWLVMFRRAGAQSLRVGLTQKTELPQSTKIALRVLYAVCIVAVVIALAFAGETISWVPLAAVQSFLISGISRILTA